MYGRKRFQLWTREAVPYEIFDESKGVQKEIIDRANGVRFRSYKESRGTIIVSFFFFFVDLEDFYSVSDRFFNACESTEWIGYLNELFDRFVDPDCGEIFFLS